MITKEEYLKRLRENKWFDNPKEMIDYRLPVVQYFLTNHTNTNLLTPKGILNSNTITILYNKRTDFPLLNQAFESIKNRTYESI